MLAPELPPLPMGDEGTPRAVLGLRLFGMFMMGLFVLSSAAAHPGIGSSATGLVVLGCCVTLLVAMAVVAQWRPLPTGVRFVALLALGTVSIVLITVQHEHSSAIAGIYFVVIIAALRLPRRQALTVAGLTVLGGVLAYESAVDDPSGQVISILTGVPPWFVVMRVMKQTRLGQRDAEALVEELRESRAAQAIAAAEAERTRVARELHDVLAHSLAGLTIQLEAARLRAARGEDGELAAQLTRAHALAVTGLDEARGAIGALRGDALPGPERLPALVAAFGPEASFTREGEPYPLSSETQLALFRATQEALTNIRKHAPETCRVDVRLCYAEVAVELRVADQGRVPVPAVPRAPGGGYGLTGMRERAELLGGELTAGPIEHGFEVVLCLPR